MEDVRFSKHALQQARKRHLWKYVSKAKFYFDAKHRAINQAQLEECVYCYTRDKKGITIITTMYHV